MTGTGKGMVMPGDSNFSDSLGKEGSTPRRFHAALEGPRKLTPHFGAHISVGNGLWRYYIPLGVEPSEKNAYMFEHNRVVDIQLAERVKTAGKEGKE